MRIMYDASEEVRMPATLTAPMPEPVVASPSLMTADEFYDFCKRDHAKSGSYELVRGEVLEMARPSGKHGVVAGIIITSLNNYFETHPIGFVAANDSGVILERDPDTVRGPDVAVYPAVASFDDLPERWFESPPMIAIEIRSPNDRQRVLARKISDYLRNGVREVWIVDFEEQFVTIHRPDRGLINLDGEQEITSEILPDYALKVARLFRMMSQQP
jgi:Uma2 family endonuclease